MQLHDTAYLSSRLFITVFLSYRITRYPRHGVWTALGATCTTPLPVMAGMEWHWLWTAGLVCDWFLSQLEQLLFG
jgi:hypothetical protein